MLLSKLLLPAQSMTLRLTEDPEREVLVDMLELGALSYLRSLQEWEGAGADGEEGVILSEAEVREKESQEREREKELGQEHWMREGERQRGRDQQLLEQQRGLDALCASREQTLELVQQFPLFGVPLSDSFGSQLMSTFLVSGEGALHSYLSPSLRLPCLVLTQGPYSISQVTWTPPSPC